ncbi:MAG: hypothetical protein V1883_03220 [Candidatus Omnitrophota bacterium]
MAGTQFPVDIYAVKEYGVKKWQGEFFWPVSDDEFVKLGTEIDRYLKDEINRQSGEMSDLLLIYSSLRAEYLLFFHALKVAQRVKAAGKELMYSDKTLWYKEIASGERMEIPKLRRGKAKYTFINRIKVEAARIIWRILYNDRLSKVFNPKENKEIVYIFNSLTPLMKLYMKNSPYTFNMTSERDWAEDSSFVSIPDNLLNSIEDTSRAISANLASTADRNGIELSDNHKGYLTKLTESMLTDAARIMYSIKPKIEDRRNARFFLSTFVSYFPRALAVLARKNGGHVTTFSHGGSIGLYDASTMAFQEFAVSDEYVTYNKKSTELFERIKNNNPALRNNDTLITSCDDNAYENMWLINRNKPLPKEIKKVMIIGYPHNQGRKYHAPGSVSLIQLDLELRLADFLRGHGYDVFYKAHPDRIAEVKGVFDDSAKVLEGYFQNYIDSVDAFIFGSIRTTAFLVALCTNKPVIGFMMENERFKPFPEALESLKKRCNMVKAKFDEHNRIVFNEKKLSDALAQKPTQPNTEFIEKYIFPEK